MRTYIIIQSSIVEISVTLIFILFLTIPINQAISKTNDEILNVSVLEEKIIEENKIREIQIKNLLEKVEAADKNNAQLITKNEEYISKLLAIYSGGIVLIFTILGILGFKTIREWIKTTIKSRVDVVLSEKYVQEIVSRKGEPAINELLEEWKKKAQKAFSKIDSEIEEYHKALIGLNSSKEAKDLSKPLSEETKKELENFVEKLTSSKIEKIYSSEDWFYKGFEEYNRGNYAKAAESFARSLEKKKTPGAFAAIALSYQQMQSFDEAELNYKKAIEIDSKNAIVLGSYALFLHEIRKDNDRADEYYRRAIEADTKNAINLGNYALFLQNVRKENDRADEYYRRAIEADTKNAINLDNYALFLQYFRKENDRADEYYRRAIEADTKNANALGNYARFLQNVRKDNDRADEYYRRAIEADTKNANALGNYARFLQNVRKDNDRADEYYRRAIEADTKNANALGNYALFLQNVLKDNDRADEYYRRSFEADAKDANNLGNYAKLLLSLGRTAEGIDYLVRAEAEKDKPAGLEIELLFYRAAHDRAMWPSILSKIKPLLKRGDRSPHWPLDTNITRAEADGHPNPALLRTLASVISTDKDISMLDSYPEWNSAA